MHVFEPRKLAGVSHMRHDLGQSINRLVAAAKAHPRGTSARAALTSGKKSRMDAATVDFCSAHSRFIFHFFAETFDFRAVGLPGDLRYEIWAARFVHSSLS